VTVLRDLSRVLCVTGSLLLGCAHPPTTALNRNTSIGKPIAKSNLESVPVKGFHVEVIYGMAECSLEGELIAVTHDSLIINGPNDILFEIPNALLVELYLELYPDSSSSIYTTTTIGSFTTTSHGLWLVVSLPLWLGVGLPLAAAESRASHLPVNYAGVPRLAQYARFPHGAVMNWQGRTKSVDACE
jgi:hypothetical protein